jgi:hypothetical protein
MAEPGPDPPGIRALTALFDGAEDLGITRAEVTEAVDYVQQLEAENRQLKRYSVMLLDTVHAANEDLSSVRLRPGWRDRKANTDYAIRARSRLEYALHRMRTTDLVRLNA